VSLGWLSESIQLAELIDKDPEVIKRCKTRKEALIELRRKDSERVDRSY